VNHKISKHLRGVLVGITYMAFTAGTFAANEVGKDATVASPAMETGGSELVVDPTKRLESLVIEVNGERRIVDPTKGIDVVLGDLLTIVEAYLVSKNTSVKTVDLVGFRSRVNGHSHDDRGRVIDTGRNLSKKRSISGDGLKYRIEASGPEGIYGVTVLNVLNPELLSLDVEINGKLKKILPDQTLQLSHSDLIRIVDVRTNVRGNENVKYDGVIKKHTKELRFSRGDKIFARIPIDWQGP